MKNPLNKRIFREIKGEAGKYIVIFLFMTALIAIVSGFLVADESLTVAYNESFEKYNVEDGNFKVSENINSKTTDEIEKENKIRLYNNFYFEDKTDDFNTTLRIFSDRKDVNKVCLLNGKMPTEKNEIALDRLYARNNNLSLGKSVKISGKTLEIVGIVALSDYSALFQNNNDFMFDTIKFGVGIMNKDGFNSLEKNKITYCFSWKYNNPPEDFKSEKAKNMGENLMKNLSTKVPLTDFIPHHSSNAINFAGEDLGGDKAIFLVMSYVLIVIIAFVFAITTSNTIAKESNVIGTLRASGFTKGELIRHYMAPPIIVLIFAGIVGNILGYTVFKNIMANQYLGSYSLTSYKTLWNANAFIDTTVIPIIIMTLITFIMLARMLSLSPLKFIRRDLKRHKRKKAFKLNTKIKIMTRFRIRVIFQNIPNYITIFVGILFAGFILIFGTMFGPLLDNVEQETVSDMVAKHQYILKAPAGTDTKNAEKFCLENLKTTGEKNVKEDISVYGFLDNSKYFHQNLSEGKVYISSGYSDKYGIKSGDKITLKEEFGDKKYAFTIDGIYENSTALAIAVNCEKFNEIFDKSDDFYSGYLSDKTINDIDKNLIATEITKDDLIKSTQQLKKSMGSMVSIFWILGAAVFMLIIYLLAKIIIEKNAQSISLAKILGYNKKEISGIYIHTTTIVTILSLIISLPILSKLLDIVWHAMMMDFTGWIPCYITPDVYAKVIIIGIVTYGIVAALLIRKTNKIPMEEALKNVE